MSRPTHPWKWLAPLLLAAAGCTGPSGGGGGGDGGFGLDAGLCPPKVIPPAADGGSGDAATASDGATDSDAGAGVVVPEGAVCDPDTGLYWQAVPVPSDLTQGEADTACQGLVMGDGLSWRLPTITELRSLVDGCDATQVGGECGVYDPDCLTASICFDLTCTGCPAGEGPGTGGCYFDLDGQLAGPCSNFWSSSLQDGFGSAAYYVLDYNDAKINRVSDTQGALARCVHLPAQLPGQP